VTNVNSFHGNLAYRQLTKHYVTDNDWVKKCMEYEMEGARPKGRPKKTWRETVEKDCKAHGLNREDAMDHSRWRKQKGIFDDHDGCNWVNVSSGTGSPGLSRTKFKGP